LLTFIRTRPAESLELRVPVIMIVLAATAIPVELRSPSYEFSGFSFSAWLTLDALANVLGYVPVGIVLWDLGPFCAVATAAFLAAFAETAQLVMVHRDPSVVDVLANVAGAIVGMAIASRWNIRRPVLLLSKGKSKIAALLAGSIIAGVWTTSAHAPTPSPRGVRLPGRLEAHWGLGELRGPRVADSSGHRLDGRFSREPNRADDGTGRAVLFDGARDYVDFGTPTALRLAGSMTVTAWINSTSYPADDAAVVSSLNGGVAGYQLDTTVDRGPRTIGFKIANECGRSAIRYGATPLAAGTWYHIAGVYDSETRTLDVFLNGQRDNGFLLGTVTCAQHSSRLPVYVGRRSDSTGYEFAGLIRGVSIYSRALTPAEIALDMQGHAADTPAPAEEVTDGVGAQEHHGSVPASCAISSDPEDKRFPIAAAGLGLLVAIAGLGRWPHSSGLLWLVASLASGFALPASTLPAINSWLIPLTSLAGGAAVIISIRRAT
jgi:hypothetical protein